MIVEIKLNVFIDVSIYDRLIMYKFFTTIVYRRYTHIITCIRVCMCVLQVIKYKKKNQFSQKKKVIKTPNYI